MEEKIVGSLFIYGPLGVICVILTIALTRLYKDIAAERKENATTMAKERKEFADQLAAERKQHHDDMVTMQDKYIETSKTMMEKYHQLADALAKVLDSIERRLLERR